MPLSEIKARRPLGCRQCAEHEGREGHEEEGRGGFCLMAGRGV